MSQPSSTKPYLVRALFDWCVDNGFTPYVAVVVDERTRVPFSYVRDGQIVLNIAPYATHQLQISNEEITCQARFGGVAHNLYVPIGNVAAIYARENGQGMTFELEGDTSGLELHTHATAAADDETQAADNNATVAGASPDEPPEPPAGPSTRGNHLRVIK